MIMNKMKAEDNIKNKTKTKTSNGLLRDGEWLQNFSTY